MGSTFNKMIDLLHQNFEKQQQFVSDASHELRTPLTVIESYAKLLKRWGMKTRCFGRICRSDLFRGSKNERYDESNVASCK